MAATRQLFADSIKNFVKFSRENPDTEIKKEYLKLVKEFHPDTKKIERGVQIQQGLPVSLGFDRHIHDGFCYPDIGTGQPFKLYSADARNVSKNLVEKPGFGRFFRKLVPKPTRFWNQLIYLHLFNNALYTTTTKYKNFIPVGG
jgi:hypothetical protein